MTCGATFLQLDPRVLEGLQFQFISGSIHTKTVSISHKIFCTELESSNYFRKILYEYNNNINNNHKNSNTFHTKYTSMLAPKVILNTQTIIGMQCMVISHRDQESPLSLNET